MRPLPKRSKRGNRCIALASIIANMKGYSSSILFEDSNRLYFRPSTSKHLDKLFKRQAELYGFGIH